VSEMFAVVLTANGRLLRKANFIASSIAEVSSLAPVSDMVSMHDTGRSRRTTAVPAGKRRLATSVRLNVARSTGT
jgi:hypothetical protein